MTLTLSVPSRRGAHAALASSVLMMYVTSSTGLAGESLWHSSSILWRKARALLCQDNPDMVFLPLVQYGNLFLTNKRFLFSLRGSFSIDKRFLFSLFSAARRPCHLTSATVPITNFNMPITQPLFTFAPELLSRQLIQLTAISWRQQTALTAWCKCQCQ